MSSINLVQNIRFSRLQSKRITNGNRFLNEHWRKFECLINVQNWLNDSGQYWNNFCTSFCIELGPGAKKKIVQKNKSPISHQINNHIGAGITAHI